MIPWICLQVSKFTAWGTLVVIFQGIHWEIYGKSVNFYQNWLEKSGVQTQIIPSFQLFPPCAERVGFHCPHIFSTSMDGNMDETSMGKSCFHPQRSELSRLQECSCAPRTSGCSWQRWDTILPFSVGKLVHLKGPHRSQNGLFNSIS